MEGGKNMTIDRLNGIGPVKLVQPIRRTHKVETLEKTDAVSLSREARVAADANLALEAVRNAPDIREDKVAEMKRKFADPSYINNTLLELVADKILDNYGF